MEYSKQLGFYRDYAGFFVGRNVDWFLSQACIPRFRNYGPNAALDKNYNIRTAYCTNLSIKSNYLWIFAWPISVFLEEGKADGSVPVALYNRKK